MKKLKASVFIATSLDGFIAREDGRIDWLPLPSAEEAEAHGYPKFLGSVDVVVLGRKSYEAVLPFPEWPYGKKKVVVLSHRPLAIPKRLAESVESMSCTPVELAKTLAKRGAKHLYVDGGKTIQGFLNAGLIQRLVITRIPVLLGRGIPLFGPLRHDVKLRHIRTRQFPSGLVQSEYEVSAARSVFPI